MSRELTWVDIDDFTPGLRSIYTAKMPPGVGDPDGSVGCIATTTGGLSGLPASSVALQAGNILAHDDPTTNVHVVGFKAIPATRLQGTGEDPNASSLAGPNHDRNRNNDPALGATHFDSIFLIATESLNTTSGVHEWCYSVHGPSLGSDTIVIDETSSVVNDVVAFARSPIIFTTNTGDNLDPEYPTDPLYPFRAGKPTSFVSRGILRGISETGVGAAEFCNSTFMFPDITDPADSYFTQWREIGNALGVGSGNFMVSHQSRVLVMRDYGNGAWTLAGTGFAGAAPWTTFQAQWSGPNVANQDPTITGATALGTLPYAAGTMASLTASDLLIITQNNGAVLVQGDLNSPTVRYLPGVVSTAGLQCDGASTSLGFVYGVGAGGVYSWQGTDGSALLSPNLPDQFWVGESTSLLWNHKGSFAQWGDWILAPNGWVMDTVSGAWWRIDADTFPAINWQVNGAFAFGAPAAYNDTTQTTAVKGFNKLSRRAAWTWMSHPFVITAHRRVHVRELVLIARLTEGTEASLSVDLLSDTGATVTYEFTVDSGITKAIRLQASFQAYNLKATIRATAGQVEVYGLRIGFDERQEEVVTQ